MAVGPSRKLVVILHADVVRAATLVQRDEALAHAIIQGACRRVSLTSKALNGVTHELRGGYAGGRVRSDVGNGVHRSLKSNQQKAKIVVTV